jgi:hypothetical protein
MSRSVQAPIFHIIKKGNGSGKWRATKAFLCRYVPHNYLQLPAVLRNFFHLIISLLRETFCCACFAKNFGRVRHHFRFEAKRKRNFFRFGAKKSAFFACFASMRNIEI